MYGCLYAGPTGQLQIEIALLHSSVAISIKIIIISGTGSRPS